ncbi:MAG: FIST N-terminal domain-containing protein [Desulfomonilaceae bacterium]|nr:FIST N-terminal domain-containing protein [Desulfomonilaceae bacterium]
MVKGATVSAKKPFSRSLGKALGEKLVHELGTPPNACWLFCEPGDGMAEMLSGIVQAVGTTKLAGCTTDGEISTSGFSTGSAVLAGLASDTIAFEVASTSSIGADSESAGRRLAQQLPRTARHVQLFSDGLTGNGCAILRGMQSVFGPQVPISGGAAGDARAMKQTWQFVGSRILTDAASAISLSGDIHVGTGVRSGWFPAGVPKKVTRSAGNVVYELDGESALAVYRRYLGPLADKLPAVGIQFPFGLVNEAGSLGENPVLRAPMTLNESQGSVSFAGEIPQGSTISLTTGGSAASLLDASTDAARRAMDSLGAVSPSITFFYSCMARKILLGPRTREETERIANVVGRSVPIIGFYTYGEYCPSVSGTDCRLHNETATVTVVGSR